MKKFLAIALTLALALCMAVPAFAAEPDIGTNNGTASVTVNGTYNAGSSAAEVISVDVSWGSMSFTYHDTVEGTWNDETHNFDGAVAAHWTCETNANKITVTNHSNTAVEAQLTFAKAENTNIVGSFDKSILNLETAVGTTYDEAPSAVAYFTITSGSIAADGELGTITITIIDK
jgi:hypothetical protein